MNETPGSRSVQGIGVWSSLEIQIVFLKLGCPVQEASIGQEMQKKRRQCRYVLRSLSVERLGDVDGAGIDRD